jgi:hypothetical protein
VPEAQKFREEYSYYCSFGWIYELFWKHTCSGGWTERYLFELVDNLYRSMPAASIASGRAVSSAGDHLLSISASLPAN